MESNLQAREVDMTMNQKTANQPQYLYGLDLSMKSTGIAIVNMQILAPIKITSVSTNHKQTYGERLYAIAQHLLFLKEKYPPYKLIIERAFDRFATATQVIYRVHGLVNYLFKETEQIYYPPKTIKQTILTGNADKTSVRMQIQAVYPQITFTNDDESDAFATALTFLIKQNYLTWNKKEGS